jgi:hypothetical protein
MHLRIRFCALRFLHFKVLATLASGGEQTAPHTQFFGMGFAPSSSLAIDRALFGVCHLTLEAVSPPRHIYALFFHARKTKR